MTDENGASAIADFAYVFAYICYLLGAACIVALAITAWSAGPKPAGDLAPDANMGLTFLVILMLMGIAGAFCIGVLLSALALSNGRHDWGLAILSLLAISISCVFMIDQGIPAYSAQQNPLSPYSLALEAGVFMYVGLVLALPAWRAINRFRPRHP